MGETVQRDVGIYVLAHGRNPFMQNGHYNPQEHGRGRQIKYHPCPRCGHQATLIVEIREEIIHQEPSGKRGYYCTICHHQFTTASR